MLGSIISAGANLVGGIMGSNATKKANAANLHYQKNYLQYRKADAEKAGFHPLAALGAQGGGPAIGVMADNSMGDALSRAGSSIGNAISNKANKQLLDLQMKATAADVAMKEAQANFYNAEARNASVKTMAVSPVPDFTQQSADASRIARGNQNQNRNLDTGAGTLEIKRGDPVEKFENEFGEVISLPYGVWHFYNNIINPHGRISSAVKWWNELSKQDPQEARMIQQTYRKY